VTLKYVVENFPFLDPTGCEINNAKTLPCTYNLLVHYFAFLSILLRRSFFIKNSKLAHLTNWCSANGFKVNSMFPMRILTRLLGFLSVAILALALGGCSAKAEFGPSRTASPGTVTGMHHVLLTVSDLSRSVHFYRDVLGMQVEHNMDHFAMLRAGDFGLALSSTLWEFEKKGEPKGVGMIPHFTTPNMDEFAARLKENGIPWLRAPVRESFGIEAFFLDPDGFQWAILAPLKP
jgi:catechol 2,3-dioxygenase-like lactoylglutathione lyase family enzyme